MIVASDNDMGWHQTKIPVRFHSPTFFARVNIKTRDIALDDVDHGGLVTKEQHPRSSTRLVYYVHSVKLVIFSSSQILGGILRLELIVLSRSIPLLPVRCLMAFSGRTLCHWTVAAA
jgi:hypothetical protein